MIHVKRIDAQRPSTAQNILRGRRTEIDFTKADSTLPVPGVEPATAFAPRAKSAWMRLVRNV